MAAISNRVIQTSIRLSWASFLLFLLFYCIAALSYPGGSYMHPEQSGFSFLQNYLCDLLDNQAINGALNSAKLYARISLAFLCLGIFLFWFHLPKLFNNRNKLLEIMRFSGMLSMSICVLLAAENHDIITRLAGLFGALAMCLAFVALFKAGFKTFFYIGLLCLVLILLNYYIYESGFLWHILPLFQKITTVACLFWFFLLNLKLHHQIRIGFKN